MIVIATGPRSNATRLLHRIVDTGSHEGKSTLHLPAYPPEFRDQDWASEFPRALFVVILRQRMPAAHSAIAAGYWPTLDEALAEHLVAHPEFIVEEIDDFLRDRGGYVGDPLTLPEPIRDANAKWLVAA